MNIWRSILLVAVVSIPGISSAEGLSGTWALQDQAAAEGYLLASRGTRGDYLICYNSGTVRQVLVSVGDEQSTLLRGGCTVFTPNGENGIAVDFVAGGAEVDHMIALGTFKRFLISDEQ